MLKQVNKLVNKYSSWLQIRNYVIVGFTAFFIDYFILYVMTEFLNVPYLISAGTSFVISVIFNYFASMKFVYVGKGIDRRLEFIMFFALAMGGLGLTELLMWVFTDEIGLHYMLSKIFVTGIVTVYNFFTRKAFLENRGQRAGHEKQDADITKM